MPDLDPAAVEAAHEQVPFGEGGHVQADEAEARAAQPSGDGMPSLSKLDPEWAKYIRRVEDMLDEARASLGRTQTLYLDALKEAAEAIARAEKAERERDVAREAADVLAKGVADAGARAERVEASLSTAREALEWIDLVAATREEYVAKAREALASLAGGEHPAGLNDKETQG